MSEPTGDSTWRHGYCDAIMNLPRNNPYKGWWHSRRYNSGYSYGLSKIWHLGIKKLAA